MLDGHTNEKCGSRPSSTLGFVGICAAIFYLTAQGPTESVALSSRFDAFLKSVVAHTGRMVCLRSSSNRYPCAG